MNVTETMVLGTKVTDIETLKHAKRSQTLFTNTFNSKLANCELNEPIVNNILVSLLNLIAG